MSTSEVEAEPRTRESQYERLLHSVREIVFEADPQGRFTFLSARWTQVTGFGLDESLGRNFMEFVHPEDRDRIFERFPIFPSTDCREQRNEVRYLTKDGGFRWFSANVRTICDARGYVLSVIGTLDDVTERKRIEQQLHVADRLASLGTLAAGVAHEINNPLAYVIANLAFAQDQVQALLATLRAGGADDLVSRLDAANESLADARHGADRVRAVVRDLKLFARPENERIEPVDIHRVLESSIAITNNEIRHRARLLTDYGSIPRTLANEARLAQIFINLLVNAAQSIKEGDAAHNEIRVRTHLHDSGNIAVEVSDTGQGISPEHLKRIFDPFFTTKPVGEGTGLGLSISHSIVSKLGGQLTAESTPGKGTIFRVLLPVAANSDETAGAAPTAAAPAASRSKILVVDDDPLVGHAVRRALEESHDVQVLTSAADALELVRAGLRWDVVLCDVMMPRVSGCELYGALEALAPDLAERVVFISGGAFTPEARAFLDTVTNRQLEKPFDAAELRSAVAAVLDRKTTAAAREAAGDEQETKGK